MAEAQKTHRIQTHPKTGSPKKPVQPGGARFKPAQLLEAPETLHPDQMLAAQQEVGNQVVQRVLDQDNGADQGTLREDLTRQIQHNRGGGQPLPSDVQREAERKLGRRLGNVRIHIDPTADRISRAIHARAFTTGKDIFFRRDAFAPSTRAGRETLHHELAHVVQQGGQAPGGALRLGAPGTAHEREARQAAQNQAAAVSPAQPGLVQRDGDKFDDFTDKYGTATDTADAVQNFAAQSSYGKGEHIADASLRSDAQNRYAGEANKVAAPMSILKGFKDLFSLIVNSKKLHGARMLHGSTTSDAERNTAYTDVKNSAKGVALAPISGTANVASATQAIAGLAGSGSVATGVANTAGSVAGGFGVGLSGIDFIRNFWGMGRAAHKARKLGGWTGKGGVIGEIEKEKNKDTTTDAQKVTLNKLQSAGKFAHGAKTRTSLLKALGVGGATLGVVGGALALASNPAGWAVGAAGAGVGLGIGAYKVIRGMVKRSHRRDKLEGAESALGMAPYKGQGNIFKRGWNWLRGNDITERRTALESKKTELEGIAASATATEDEKRAAQAKLNALGSAQVGGKGDLFARAMETQKQRHAKTITENLGTNTHANALGEALGISDKQGGIKKSPGLANPIKALKRMFGHAEYGAAPTSATDKEHVKKQMEREFGFK